MFTISSSLKDFPKNNHKKYKVIINAGGGIYGYIITNFMSYLDFDLYKKIDVAAGTSIGGILSMYYSIEHHYQWINNAFSLMAPFIFKDKKFGLNTPKYSNKNLKYFLTKIFNELKLSDVTKNNILITSTDFTLKQLRIFENFNLKESQNLKLVDIGLCTSAAPTYFPAQEVNWSILDDLEHKSLSEKFLQSIEHNHDKLNNNINKKSIIFDGGILENIPIISTYTTLHNEFGVDPKDIDIFVFGAGDKINIKNFNLEKVNKWSCISTLRNLIIPYVTQSNEQTSIFWGLQMGFNSFTYFNPIKVDRRIG